MRSKTSRNRYRFHSRTRTRCRAPTPPSCRSPIGSRSAGAPAQQAADPTSQAEKSSQISPTTLFETIVARPNSSDKTIETVDATSRTWSRKASRHPCLHLLSQPAPIRPNGLFRQKTGIRPSGRSIVTAFAPNTPATCTVIRKTGCASRLPNRQRRNFARSTGAETDQHPTEAAMQPLLPDFSSYFFRNTRT